MCSSDLSEIEDNQPVNSNTKKDKKSKQKRWTKPQKQPVKKEDNNNVVAKGASVQSVTEKKKVSKSLKLMMDNPFLQGLPSISKRDVALNALIEHLYSKHPHLRGDHLIENHELVAFARKAVDPVELQKFILPFGETKATEFLNLTSFYRSDVSRLLKKFDEENSKVKSDLKTWKVKGPEKKGDSVTLVDDDIIKAAFGSTTNSKSKEKDSNEQSNEVGSKEHESSKRRRSEIDPKFDDDKEDND